jgi:biotin carboxyl carrier protein
MNEYIVRLNGKDKIISLNDLELKIDGESFQYEYEKLFDGRYILHTGNKFFDISAQKINTENFVLVINGKTFETEARTLLEEKARKLLEQSSQNIKEHEAKAPMPGMILKIRKKQGDSIKSDETIMILEAMKMENELKSSSNGKIKDIYVKEGDKVEKGVKLFTIE